MRKYLLIVTVLLFAGCGGESTPDPHPYIAHEKETYAHKMIVDGHSYIVFSHSVYSGYSISVLHDPNCPACKATTRTTP